MAELALTVLSLIIVWLTFQNGLLALIGSPILASCSNSAHCTRGIAVLIGLIVVVVAAPILLVGSWRAKERPRQLMFVAAGVVIAVIPSIAIAVIEGNLSSILIV